MTLKIKKEHLYISGTFLLSCISSAFIYLYLIYVFTEIRKNNEGFLKICILYTLRQVLYFPGIPRLSSLQTTFKLLLIAMASIWIIAINFNNSIRRMYIGVALPLGFGVCALFSTVCFSSYPIAGSIKVVSFSLVLVAIIIAAINCVNTFDLEKYLYSILSLIMFVSFCCLPLPQAYLKGSSGLLFRGVWDHPNDFGVVCALFLALILARHKELKIRQILQCGIVFFMIFMSGSRGAMIAAISIFALFLFSGKTTAEFNRLTILILAIGTIFLTTPIFDNLIGFFAKGSHQLSLKSFSSREEVLKIAMRRFNSNPLFGRGLLLPYVPGSRSLAPDIDPTEPGNIFLELLAGSGLIGTVIFTGMLLYIFSKAVKKKKIYVFAVLMASMSEVSFFSVNNYACLYYLLIAIAVSNRFSRPNLR